MSCASVLVALACRTADAPTHVDPSRGALGFVLARAGTPLPAPPHVEPEPNDLETRAWRRIRAAADLQRESTYDRRTPPEWLTRAARDAVAAAYHSAFGERAPYDARVFALRLAAPRETSSEPATRGNFVFVREMPGSQHSQRRATIELRACADGALLATATPRECPDAGYAFACGRDVDGDGTGDFAIGHSGGIGECWGVGVEVLSGADLRSLLFVPDPAPGGYIEGFGASVAFVRDLDGDGAAEIAIGCEEDIDHGDDYYVLVVSGRTGACIGSTATFGRHVRVAALDEDVDGDGRDELLLHYPETGDAWIVRGSDVVSSRHRDEGWQPLYSLAPPSR